MHRFETSFAFAHSLVLQAKWSLFYGLITKWWAAQSYWECWHCSSSCGIVKVDWDPEVGRDRIFSTLQGLRAPHTRLETTRGKCKINANGSSAILRITLLPSPSAPLKGVLASASQGGGSQSTPMGSTALERNKWLGTAGRSAVFLDRVTAQRQIVLWGTISEGGCGGEKPHSSNPNLGPSPTLFVKTKEWSAKHWIPPCRYFFLVWL